MPFELAIALTLAAAPAARPPAVAPAKAATTVAQAAPANTTTTTQQGLRLDDYLRDRGSEFSRMDANGDGTVSLQELTDFQAKAEAARTIAHYQKLFGALDTDHNGVLTGQEFMVLAQPRVTTDPKLLFGSLDTNHDGRISRSEFVVKMSTNFDRLDFNKDGIIDQSEIARDKARSNAAPAAR